MVSHSLSQEQTGGWIAAWPSTALVPQTMKAAQHLAKLLSSSKAWGCTKVGQDVPGDYMTKVSQTRT